MSLSKLVRKPGMVNNFIEYSVISPFFLWFSFQGFFPTLCPDLPHPNMFTHADLFRKSCVLANDSIAIFQHSIFLEINKLITSVFQHICFKWTTLRMILIIFWYCNLLPLRALLYILRQNSKKTFLVYRCIKNAFICVNIQKISFFFRLALFFSNIPALCKICLYWLCLISSFQGK